jgi:hypothetical protein
MHRRRSWSLRIRRLAYARAGQRCERCRRPTDLTLHHVDGDNRNSTLANAMVLCVTCHFWKHHLRRRHHKPRA